MLKKRLRSIFQTALTHSCPLVLADSAPPVQTPHTTLTARELAAKLTAASNNDPDSGRMPGLNESSPRNGANMAGSNKWGVEFGIIKPDVMIRLTNRYDEE